MNSSIKPSEVSIANMSRNVKQSLLSRQQPEDQDKKDKEQK